MAGHLGGGGLQGAYGLIQGGIGLQLAVAD